MNRSGIIKAKGASPLALFTAVFNLPFVGKNLYQGIVKNRKIAVDKDAVYNFLNSSTYNWRRFSLLFFKQVYLPVKNLFDDSSEEVLILDDSTYDRSRSKKIELLSRVFDHTTKKYFKGFRMLLPLAGLTGTLFSGLILHFCHLQKKKTGIMKPTLTLIKEPADINVDRRRLQKVHSFLNQW